MLLHIVPVTRSERMMFDEGGKVLPAGQQFFRHVFLWPFGGSFIVV